MGYATVCRMLDENGRVTPSIFTVNNMFEEALQVTRITMTEAERFGLAICVEVFSSFPPFYFFLR